MPMESIDQCEAAGTKLMQNNKEGGHIQGNEPAFRFGYDCILGGEWLAFLLRLISAEH